VTNKEKLRVRGFEFDIRKVNIPTPESALRAAKTFCLNNKFDASIQSNIGNQILKLVREHAQQ